MEVVPFSVFTNVQGHWSGFTKILAGTFQEKGVTFEEKLLEPSNCTILCLNDALKSHKLLRLSKIPSMSKIENMEGGAKLHHNPLVGVKRQKEFSYWRCDLAFVRIFYNFQVYNFLNKHYVLELGGLNLWFHNAKNMSQKLGPNHKENFNWMERYMSGSLQTYQEKSVATKY